MAYFICPDCGTRTYVEAGTIKHKYRITKARAAAVRATLDRFDEDYAESGPIGDVPVGAVIAALALRKGLT